MDTILKKQISGILSTKVQHGEFILVNVLTFKFCVILSMLLNTGARDSSV